MNPIAAYRAYRVARTVPWGRVAAAAAVAVAAVVAAGVAAVLIIVAAIDADPDATPGTTCTPAAQPGRTHDDLSVADITGTRLDAATAIYAAAAAAGPDQHQAAVIGVATALQESRLDASLTEAQSDRDSFGLFQQRRPWGPLRTTAAGAAQQFYRGGAGGQRGLLDVPGWQSLPVTRAAQAVQVSAFPDAYASWEPLAREIVAKVAAEPGAVTAAAAVAAACTDADPTADVVPASAGGWSLPVTGVPPNSEYGYRLHPIYGTQRLHGGLDFAADCGTPIAAAADGTVVTAATVPSFGNLVVLDHAGGVRTYYAHQADGAITVGPGDTVTRGQRIGAIGSTGDSTGCHLHFETRVPPTPGAEAVRTDPRDWLTARGLSVPTE